MPEREVTMKLWPDAGRKLKLSRNATYEAAAAGQIPTMRFGRVYRVPVAQFEKMLAGEWQPPKDAPAPARTRPGRAA